MDIKEIMERRVSVRTFNPSIPAGEKEENILRQTIEEVRSPFGGEFRIFLKRFELTGELRPGTYGVISGASMYLLLAVKDNDRQAELAAGFAMEQVILKATELGLGTCWIAATFKNSDFSECLSLPEGYSLRVISPVGYKAEKKRLMERITRTIAGSSKRKPMEKLFSMTDSGEPVPENNLFYTALQMVRLAPSSVNSQPWRAEVSDNKVSFTCATDNSCSCFDMGIALCHFCLTINSEEIEGRFSLSENMFPITFTVL